jgi:hypothetical protein
MHQIFSPPCVTFLIARVFIDQQGGRIEKLWFFPAVESDLVEYEEKELGALHSLKQDVHFI